MVQFENWYKAICICHPSSEKHIHICAYIGSENNLEETAAKLLIGNWIGWEGCREKTRVLLSETSFAINFLD